MEASAIVLFAHGARHPEWAGPFARLKDELEALRPGERVALAFLELMQPSLSQCAATLYAEGVRTLRVVPVFFGVGGHLRTDLPGIVGELKARYRDMEISVDAPIGEQAGVISAIAKAIAG